MKVLIVVDAQVDFITGSLHNADAVAAVPRIKQLVEQAHEEGYFVIWTKDTHDQSYYMTKEHQYLPVDHCQKGTYGHQLDPVLNDLVMEDDKVIEKPTFGSIDLMNEILMCDEACDIDEIHICGFCTDICVVSNALMVRACLPNVDIIVHRFACAGTTEAKHYEALSVMQSCQIDLEPGM